MKLGLNIGYQAKRVKVPMDLVLQAETLGFDSVWASESYGADAVSLSSWVLAKTQKIKVGTAIMQIPARTPACTAMTAMGLAQLSEGRFILGLGASGPLVVEGWHGQPYARAVTRTAEYIQIIRKIMEREGPVAFDGEIYSLPYQGEGSTGLGRPLKSILAADPNIPIYAASFTPAGLRAAGEHADGVFPIWMDPERFDVLEKDLSAGFKKAKNKSLANFDVAPSVTIILGDDVEACRAPVKDFLALYLGGMGSREKNFYNDYAKKIGYEEAAVTIQDLYLSGKKAEAVAAVPNELVDSISLIGPKERIAEHAQKWKDAAAKNHVGSLLLSTQQPEALEVAAKIFL